MKGFLTITLCCLLTTSYGQTIILSNYPKTVPKDKKWILPTGKEILIEVTSGTLRSGNMCNALILSNPKIIKGIVEGDYGRPNKSYTILFQEHDKVAYTNNYTYSILPVSIVDNKFSLLNLQYKAAEEVGSKQIVFYPGQKVYVSECLQSLQLFEVNLTAKELADIKKKEDEEKLAELKKKQDEENQKLKTEQERIDKIINSSHFFYSNEITNKKDIKLTVKSDALPIFYEYLLEFKKHYGTSFEDKIVTYKKNMSYSGKSDYSMFDFSFYFDKQGNLKRITNNRVFVNGEGSKNIDFDISWLGQLKPFVSLNKPASIKLGDKEYIVNSYYMTFFDFYESSTRSNAQISLNNKGEITVLTSNLKYNNEKLIEMIERSSYATGLLKGKYSVTVATDKTTCQFTHFQNYDTKEIITTEKETNTISSIDKL